MRGRFRQQRLAVLDRHAHLERASEDVRASQRALPALASCAEIRPASRRAPGRIEADVTVRTADEPRQHALRARVTTGDTRALRLTADALTRSGRSRGAARSTRYGQRRTSFLVRFFRLFETEVELFAVQLLQPLFDVLVVHLVAPAPTARRCGTHALGGRGATAAAPRWHTTASRRLVVELAPFANFLAEAQARCTTGCG